VRGEEAAVRAAVEEDRAAGLAQALRGLVDRQLAVLHVREAHAAGQRLGESLAEAQRPAVVYCNESLSRAQPIRQRRSLLSTA